VSFESATGSEAGCVATAGDYAFTGWIDILTGVIAYRRTDGEGAGQSS
jgi:hypothetical protein